MTMKVNDVFVKGSFIHILAFHVIHTDRGSWWLLSPFIFFFSKMKMSVFGFSCFKSKVSGIQIRVVLYCDRIIHFIIFIEKMYIIRLNIVQCCFLFMFNGFYCSCTMFVRTCHLPWHLQKETPNGKPIISLKETCFLTMSIWTLSLSFFLVSPIFQM